MEYRYQNIISTIDNLMSNSYSNDKPGAAVMLMLDNTIIYQKGFGVANLESGEKITLSTNFRMASVSKQFTAICVALLEQKGKLSFDDNLKSLFPNFNNTTGSKIKVSHLLTHTSGLLDYEEFIVESMTTNQLTDQNVYELIASQDKTYFEPGSTFRYSNTGFVLLGLIIEIVSKQSYEQFIKNHIFDPLNMYTTTIYHKNESVKNRAMGYARNENNEFYLSDQSVMSATRGDGCLYTSLEDYLKWSNALFHLPNLVDLINFPINNHQFYGMGWFLEKSKNVSMLHIGNTCGFSNMVIRIPDKKALIVYFSNIADNQLIKNFCHILEQIPELNPETDLLWTMEKLTR
ncbi:unnamed protein product [Didymodactylos carnosus]|uniref:Beta-lactamase-related domain-containing protein n=1 Tax=Didymodactylos carnosus TaxID=1234261 RepID=A0A814V8J3_9BILA|nr:unnamed protein product [Didymodactylos carnosus]CAF1182060.1 unnamed protein product [Didymodactylos carnosus]CAF3563556.1 unnamed protein product [Didymodactylos carnosus]CAF3946369.1 unnamed protein product [Didymodactylos carnosus]